MAATAIEAIQEAQSLCNTVHSNVNPPFVVVEQLVERLDDGEEIDAAELLSKLTQVRDELAEALNILG